MYVYKYKHQWHPIRKTLWKCKPWISIVFVERSQIILFQNGRWIGKLCQVSLWELKKCWDLKVIFLHVNRSHPCLKKNKTPQSWLWKKIIYYIWVFPLKHNSNTISMASTFSFIKSLWNIYNILTIDKKVC